MNWDWINSIGLIIVVLLLIPNIIYAYKKKHIENKCTNRALIVLEQIGRYGSMILMVLNLGIPEFGFWSKNGFVIWLLSIPVLILSYWIIWFVYFRKQTKFSAMLLAIIPSAIFIVNGLLLAHWLLVTFGIIFSVCHIRITYMNNVS